MLRKKIILWCVITASIWLLLGCKEEKENIKTVSSDDTPMFELLTEEQKRYLIEEQYFSEDRINMMEYEAVNWQLLGTGFELYNQSSGVEKFGVLYKDTDPISGISESDEIIKLEKVIEIRKKEKEMRLNDFAEYKYEIEEYSDRYKMSIPIADYDSTYVVIGYTKNDEGYVHMQVPHIIHDKKGTADYGFSILYDAESMRLYYEEEPKYDLNRRYIEVQYTSVTENSIVLEVWNSVENECKLVADYKLYEIADGKEKLIDEAKGEERKLIANSYSIEAVKFSENVKLEEGKKYLIKFGKKWLGCFYDEIEFTK